MSRICYDQAKRLLGDAYLDLVDVATNSDLGVLDRDKITQALEILEEIIS